MKCQHFLAQIMTNINRITPQDHDYSKLLTEIAKPPQEIYCIGTLPTQRRPSVAIVGSRRPTPYGREVTEQFAAALSRQGVVIISGLALGVDSIAHRACLATGGTTIAVLGNPLPRIYPANHRALADEIVAHGGAIISEHREGDGYIFGRWSFLERNRLVAGLADVVLVTEAAARSGTLSTAAHAIEQGKDVFVIPGNITSPLSEGCNNLLKQGAHVATSPDDLVTVLLPHSSATQQSTQTVGTTPLETAIIQQLQQGLRDGEEVQRHLQVSASEFNVALTMLEIQGIVRPLGSNQWVLC